MITVSKGVLKAKMLAYFRQVEETGETLVVTDHRKPVLRLEPIRNAQSLVSAFADLQGKLRAKDKDLIAAETQEWEADGQPGNRRCDPGDLAPQCGPGLVSSRPG